MSDSEACGTTRTIRRQLTHPPRPPPAVPLRANCRSDGGTACCLSSGADTASRRWLLVASRRELPAGEDACSDESKGAVGCGVAWARVLSGLQARLAHTAPAA